MSYRESGESITPERARADGAEAGMSVAIVYHYLAHYREPIMSLLSCAQEGSVSYEIYSSDRANIASLATIAAEKSRDVSPAGNMNWHFVRNHWLTPKLLWQSDIVGIAMRGRFDCFIFLGNAYFLSTWVAALVARLRGKRVLMWTHGFRANERGLKGWIRDRFYKLAHGWLLYGHRAREIMLGRGFDPEGLYVVFNSLDFDRQQAILERADPDVLAGLFPGLSAPRLCFSGRVTFEKELDVLIKAMDVARTRGILLALVVIGDGPAIPQLKALVKDLDLERFVVFFGPCYEEERLGPLLAAADLCVSPGPIGLAAIHAMAYGTPVIANDDFGTQGPEFEAIREGVTGAFFKRGDAVDLAETIMRWLSAPGRRARAREETLRLVQALYTPRNQKAIMDAAVRGVPAPVVNELHRAGAA